MANTLPEEQATMMTYGDQLIQKGFEQGLQHGTQQYRKATAQRMIREGYSMKQIKDITDLNVDEISNLEMTDDVKEVAE